MAAALEILLVEDNEGDIEMVQRALRAQPGVSHIWVVNDGMAALDFLHKRGDFAEAPVPHIILLDLNMPRMDGKRFLEAVKQEPKFQSIPVIMLTSSQSPADIRQCYERHASCYIVKPFDGKVFADVVRRAVGFWSELCTFAR